MVKARLMERQGRRRGRRREQLFGRVREGGLNTGIAVVVAQVESSFGWVRVRFEMVN